MPDPVTPTPPDGQPGTDVATRPATMTGFPRVGVPSAAGIVATVGVLVAIAFLARVGGSLTVFVIGLILAFLLDPIVTWLAARKVPRGLATLLTMAVFFVVLGFLVVSFLDVVVTQAGAFVASLPAAFANLEAWVVGLGLSPGVQEDLLAFLDGLEEAIANFDFAALLAPLFDFALAFLGAFFTILTLPFFMFYVLAGRPSIAKSVYDTLPAPWNLDAHTVIRISLDSFGTYVRAEAIVAGIVGVMVFVGNMGLSVLVDPAFAEVALLLALIGAFSELIPNYGPWIAAIPAVLFALTISPVAVVAVALLYIVVMFVEGQVLVPKIEGGAFSFHPALVLFLVVAGVALFGILGAILALPVSAAAWRITRYAFRRSAGAPPGMTTAVGAQELSEGVVKPYDPETGIPEGEGPRPAARPAPDATPPPEALPG